MTSTPSVFWKTQPAKSDIVEFNKANPYTLMLDTANGVVDASTNNHVFTWNFPAIEVKKDSMLILQNFCRLSATTPSSGVAIIRVGLNDPSSYHSSGTKNNIIGYFEQYSIVGQVENLNVSTGIVVKAGTYLSSLRVGYEDFNLANIYTTAISRMLYKFVLVEL